MRILIELTYYRPHTSGLTIYVERLARSLVRRGHEVTVLTSQFDKELPREEYIEGVRVVRVPVLFRISKGVIMPTFGTIANRLVLEHDVISLHLPQLDALGLAIRGRLLKKPTVITYHCDLKMPVGILSWLANRLVDLMNNLAALFAHRIVAYTQDYADHSLFLKRFSRKLLFIDPPVELPKVTNKEIVSFRKVNNLGAQSPVIGIAARFASEKGIEVLLNAFPKVINEFPDAQIWFAGPYKNILGEEKYYHRLAPQIQEFEKRGHWKFLGNLNPEQMAAFYPNLDVLVIPSLNSTESFGLVQIEAMINSVPVIASNLPGVRQPVTQLHLGKIFPVGDSKSLSDCIIEILKKPIILKNMQMQIIKRFSPTMIAAKYEDLFLELRNELQQQK